MSNTFITDAVTAHVASVTLDRNAEQAFAHSAQAFAEAVENGVTVRDLVEALKAAKKDGQAVEYTSAGSVGFHARTGRVSLLEGDLPEGVTLRNVQTVIKGLGAKVADAAISSASSKAEAFAALVAASEAAAVEQSSEEQDEESSEGDEVVVAKTALDYLTAAAGSIAKALDLVMGAPSNVSEDTAAMIISLQASLAEASFVINNQEVAIAEVAA